MLLLCKDQDRIVESLDSKCVALDQTVKQNEAIIRQLKEFRQNLIYETAIGRKRKNMFNVYYINYAKAFEIAMQMGYRKDGLFTNMPLYLVGRTKELL